MAVNYQLLLIRRNQSGPTHNLLLSHYNYKKIIIIIKLLLFK